eukprot:m.43387 g.43387  ORF g.43387 m.43387 type:complete len:126 (+) comp33427_c0_seq4:140-517(+)
MAAFNSPEGYPPIVTVVRLKEEKCSRVHEAHTPCSIILKLKRVEHIQTFYCRWKFYSKAKILSTPAMDAQCAPRYTFMHRLYIKPCAHMYQSSQSGMTISPSRSLIAKRSCSVTNVSRAIQFVFT